jgi:AraC-like DNA-binding protein
MMQTEGGTRLSQGDRWCEVPEGEIGLLDETEPFVLSGSSDSQIVFLRMPRAAVASRHPALMRQMAVGWDPQHAGARLVCAALTTIMAALPHLNERQRSSALISFVHMLGVLESEPTEAASRWRVNAAADFIEAHFCNPELSAGEVALAQRISRRRLDAILIAATGSSISAQIWSRRLHQAAQDLLDRRYGDRSVSSIGYANGFNHPAHFTRAFKARYGATPQQYRLLS